MCGIVGFVSTRDGFDGSEESEVLRMAKTLVHRGPDDLGTWVDSKAGVALGHSRLSIQDLSEAGHQPMVSRDGRFVLVFNGEIYNHLELRNEIERLTSVDWRGHSDTETLLLGVELFGLEKSLRKAVGMFALAVWDREEHRLTLARDRMGEKPLYYGWENGFFIFASELKAIKGSSRISTDLDTTGISFYIQYGYIPAPCSMYRNVKKLEPGNLLELGEGSDPESLRKRSFWSIDEISGTGIQSPFEGAEEEALSHFDFLLSRSIKGQLIGDVPVGAFLSGGIDSSLIVAKMQQEAAGQVKTFNIGFESDEHDESAHASAIAKALRTEHVCLRVSENDGKDMIPDLVKVYDEPFADASAIPTLMVAKLARESVTVSLSGDGGDELFGGYSRYDSTAHHWSRLKRLPYPLRNTVGGLTEKVMRVSDEPFLWLSKGILRSGSRYSSAGELLWLAIRGSQARHIGELYALKNASNRRLDILNVDFVEDSLEKTYYGNRLPESRDEVEKLMCIDQNLYLADDILVKVDRACMASSLESRIPLLDHRIVEWTWTIDQSLKWRDGYGKYLLKRLLGRYLEPSLFERPKQGFGVPIGSWLRSGLRDWAEELLSTENLQRTRVLNSRAVKRYWNEHLSGKVNHQYRLWQILLLQDWFGREQ